MSAAFPEIPKGSPESIAGAARRLKHAGERLGDVAAGLEATAGGLQADWEGYAAGQYREASTGLRAVAHAAARSLAHVAHAVERYGQDLEDAQSDLRRLRTAHDAAVTKAATLAADASRLATLAAQPDPPHGAHHDAAAKQGHADAAAGDADELLHRAQVRLQHFHDRERDARDALTGQDVGRPGGLGAPGSNWLLGPQLGPGNGIEPGFGIPPGGLSPFDGTVRVGDPWNSDVPGLGTYWDSQHGALQDVDDLTVAVTFAVGGGELIGLKALARGARAGAGALARVFGAQTTKDAEERAYQQAFERAITRREPGMTRSQVKSAARRAGRQARRQAEQDLRSRRAGAMGKAMDVAENLGAKLPPGLKEMGPHLYEHSVAIRYQVLFFLMRGEALARARSGVVPAAIVRAIERIKAIVQP